VSDRVKAIIGGLAGLAWLVVIGFGSAWSSNPLESFVFYVFATIMAGSSLAIALSRSIVRSAVWLLGTLGGAAMLYFLLAANLLGAIQLIVYAGGILILIVFGVMLTARTPHMRSEPRAGEIVMASLVGLILFVGLVSVSLSGRWPVIPGAPAAGAGAKVASVHDIGTKLLTDYLVPFEVVSVLLLAVMIGAAYLARPEKR
jgi:NADH:ubiquinone oxidoreductase subunit 6 (subunit J)